MRQGQQNRRGRGRNRKHQNPLTRSFESNGPDVKVRGTPAHIAEKYMSLARDATASGDPVLAENYLQHAEHYNRIIMAYREQFQQPGGEMHGGNGYRQRSAEGMDGDDFGDEEGDDLIDDAGSGPQPAMAVGPQGERPHGQERAQQDRSHHDRPHHDRPHSDRPHNDRSQYDRGQQHRGPGMQAHDRGFDGPAGDDNRGERPFRRDREHGRFRDRNRHRGNDNRGNGERYYENGGGRPDARGDRFDNSGDRDRGERDRGDRGDRGSDRPQRMHDSPRNEVAEAPERIDRIERAPVEVVEPAPVAVAPPPAPAAEAPERPSRRGGGERFQEHNQPGFLRAPRTSQRRARVATEAPEAAAEPASDVPPAPKPAD